MSARPPRSLTLALLWLSIWEPLAPASRRGTWRDQWRADLWHYAAWLAREERSSASRAVSLLARASACVPHAALLRTREWSLHMLLHDLKFAWRMTIRRPAFTAVAILILGLGIGANATIFSWVQTVLLDPLPAAGDADRLVSLRGTAQGRADLSFSYPNFQDFRDAAPPGIEDVIAFRPVAMNLRTASEPIRVWGELVTANFFDVLRVRPVLGRGFLLSDAAAPGQAPVAIISHAAWQRHFGGDASTVGRAITLNGRAFTVVGIAPEGFRGSVGGLALDVFVPITMQQAVMAGDRLGERGNSFLQVLGRLGPAVSIEQAQASASVVAARLAEAHPDYNHGRGVVLLPLWKDGASGVMLPVMATLMAVVGVVLLIACANLAGLLLARAAGRAREIAVRLSLGASRGRLVRQLLVESALLAAGGGVAGVVISYWTAGMLSAFIPPTPFPIDFTARVSTEVLVFSTGLTVLTGIAFGLLPALRASRPEVAAALKAGGGTIASGRRGSRLRQTLVVAQVALSLLLLVCASLFVRSVGRAHAIDPGFSLRHGVLAAIDLLPNGYDQARGIVFYQQLLERLSAIPGVESATIATNMPLDLGSGSDMGVQIAGYQPPGNEEVQAYYNRIGPGYFDTMGIPIVSGRAIDARDVEGSPLSVVINETMARRYWEGRDPIGATVRFGSGPAVVVGVARDGKYGRLNEAPRNYLYVPIYQYYRPDVLLQVRTRGSDADVMPALRREVQALDSNLPLFDVRTIDEHLQISLFIARMASTLLGLFGLLALVLAVVGLYSVVAFNVAQRTREIGVRMALGAGRGEIIRLVLRQGVRLIAIGAAAGLLLAAGAAQALASQLVALSPFDPVSFGGTTLVLLAVAVLACAVPARRASGLDPLTALRRD